MLRLVLFACLISALGGCSSADEGEGSGGAAGSSGSGGAGSGGTGAVAGSQTCTNWCSKQSQMNIALSCESKYDDCPEFCNLTTNATPSCADEYDALFACQATTPDSEWYCGPNGQLARVKEGVCATEYSAVEECIS